MHKGKGPTLKPTAGLVAVAFFTAAATIIEAVVISPDDPVDAFASILLAGVVATMGAACFWRE